VYAANVPDLDAVQLLVKPGYSLRRSNADVLAWLDADSYRASREPLGLRSHGHTGHTGPKISTLCFVRDAAISRHGLELLLGAIEKNLGPALLRLKGLVRVKECPQTPAVIQGAQHLLHNLMWLPAWPSEDHSTRIVFITSGIEPRELEEMIELLDRVAQRTASARERAAQCS
jgi:G3E family GTPase